VKETINPSKLPRLKKSPTGIRGLDEVTNGGLPTGRPTIVSGGPGCGKTLLALEFLVRGATRFNEPGVFVAFEESPHELIENSGSLGFDLKRLIVRKKLFLDFIYIERSEIQETGEYDLEGLFIRLQHAIETVRAKRIVLDTLEALFSGFSNVAILRAEMRRLFRWLKQRGITTVITAERSDSNLSRYGLEEYVSDCVILLDHRVNDQLSTRRLRVMKYRGSLHGTNEYPFLIEQGGISVLPITSLELRHVASAQRISTGIPDLDAMFEGKGYYRGTTILISGTAGTGKTSLAATFANEACRRGDRCLYVAFEESVSQILRNMRSIGVNLQPWMKSGLLTFRASRPTQHGLEMHLLEIHRQVQQLKPQVVIVDPMTDLLHGGSSMEIRSMLMRLIDYLKSENVTAVFTSLTSAGDHLEQTDVGVSSLIDAWLVLRELEIDLERRRALYIVKARGMAHSHRICEFILTDKGVKLSPSFPSESEAPGRLSVEAGSAARKKRQSGIVQPSLQDRSQGNNRSALQFRRKMSASLTEFGQSTGDGR
jgi:circadian clock protein KaiC